VAPHRLIILRFHAPHEYTDKSAHTGMDQFEVVYFLSAMSNLILMRKILDGSNCLWNVVFPVTCGSYCVDKIWGLRLELCQATLYGV
jgi:hypothetical protein